MGPSQTTVHGFRALMRKLQASTVPELRYFRQAVKAAMGATPFFCRHLLVLDCTTHTSAKHAGVRVTHGTFVKWGVGGGGGGW